jgi:hypothetical protein
MEKMKYVRLEQYNQVIIFPLVMEHSTFKHLSPKTAGFCYFNPDKSRVDCFGESISLGLKSNKQEDTYHATKQIFGFDDATALLFEPSTE